MKVWEKLIDDFTNNQHLEAKVFQTNEVKWSYFNDHIRDQKIKNGFLYTTLIFKVENKFLQIKANISYEFKTKKVILTAVSIALFRTLGDNGLKVNLVNEAISFPDFENKIEEIAKNKNFILNINDTTEIIDAIKLYKKIDDYRQDNQSAFLPYSNFNLYWVSQVDLKLTSDKNVDLIKGKHFSYVKSKETSKLASDSFSKELIMLKSKKELKLNSNIGKTLNGIIRNGSRLSYGKEASREKEHNFAKLIDYKIKKVSKNNSILTLFIEEDNEIFDQEDFICIYDRLSYIKSKTMLSVVDDIQNRKINNNNLFEYLFNNGKFENIANILNWKIDSSLAKTLSQKFNKEQKEAFNKAIDQFPVTFIQGPPGTGKTFVITEICKYYAKLKKNVLVSSQTNVAVENILENLMTDQSFNDLCVKAEAGKSVYALTNITKAYEDKIAKMLKLPNVDLSYKPIIDLIIDSHIIGSTTTSSSLQNRIWHDFSNEIDVLIVDEISKSSVPELIRYVVNAKKIIFVGDQRQLAPLDEFTNDEDVFDDFETKDKEIIKKFISVSVFDKLFEDMKDHQRAITLKDNYRSVSSLLNIYSLFYNNALIPLRENNDSKIQWEQNVTPFYPFTFMAMNGSKETNAKNNKSRKNILEAEFVDDLLIDLAKKIKNSKELSVAIIATYGAQVAQIRQSVALNEYRNLHFKDIKINTVDAFQGEQADIVIISTVLANAINPRGFGFIKDYRRLNVAISRAKDLAIMLGNDSILRQIPTEYDQKNRLFFNEIFEQLEKQQSSSFQNAILRKKVN